MTSPKTILTVKVTDSLDAGNGEVGDSEEALAAITSKLCIVEEGDAEGVGVTKSQGSCWTRRLVRYGQSDCLLQYSECDMLNFIDS